MSKHLHSQPSAAPHTLTDHQLTGRNLINCQNISQMRPAPSQANILLSAKQPPELKIKSNDFIGSIEELLDTLALPSTLKSTLYDAKHFPLRVPRAFVSKMAKGDPNDPLLLQVLPLHLEKHTQAGFSADPLGEQTANTERSIIHKYKNRLLLTLTGACAIHCRYCFRQHFDYGANLPKTEDWQHILNYIQANPTVDEVILSGGDPLMLSNKKLASAIARLETLPQLRTLRIHSRTPVVMPSRLNADFLDVLKQSRFRIVLVVHANHPNEVDAELKQKLIPFWHAGIHLLNQSVLLKGVNDDASTLASLSHKLFDAHITPYYLHLLDKVAGAAHFDLELARAKLIYAKLQTKVSGYLLPKLVAEQAGAKHKTLITF